MYSLPFSVQVTNPVGLISIIQQPSGSVDVAVALPVQPRLYITSVGPSLAGQRVQANTDPSCTPGTSLLFATCTILPDSTCEFKNLAVVGIVREVTSSEPPTFVCGASFLFCAGGAKSLLSFLNFWRDVPDFATGLCEGVSRA